VYCQAWTDDSDEGEAQVKVMEARDIYKLTYISHPGGRVRSVLVYAADEDEARNAACCYKTNVEVLAGVSLVEPHDPRKVRQ
jgi:hypothetical protein